MHHGLLSIELPKVIDLHKYNKRTTSALQRKLHKGVYK